MRSVRSQEHHRRLHLDVHVLMLGGIIGSLTSDQLLDPVYKMLEDVFYPLGISSEYTKHDVRRHRMPLLPSSPIWWIQEST